MSYSHNIEADFAAAELASMFAADPRLCYASSLKPPRISASAGHEPSASPWPKADGLVSVLESEGQDLRAVAIEYKREQEGIHGLLTGLGQAQAYLHKGYNGAALVVPKTYSTLLDPCMYVANVLTAIGAKPALGLFGYEPPDTKSATPFRGRLVCIRALSLDTAQSTIAVSSTKTQTQWVHMREGSTIRDAFFRFLQTAKLVSAQGPSVPVALPVALVTAVARVAPGEDPYRYLSSANDDKLLSQIWREFWFHWLATPEVLTPWIKTGSTYRVPGAKTKILKEDGTGLSELWEGRATSLKNRLVAALNSGTLSEDKAWEAFIEGTDRPGTHLSGSAKETQGVRARAHSNREDIDSALVQLQLIEPDGRLTDMGHHYVTLCERYGGANSEAAKDYIGASLLQIGHYGSFLHYFYRLSEEKFSADPLAFTRVDRKGKPQFSEDSYWDYLDYIESKLTNELKVMRKVALRSATRRRTNFQAELTLLRRYGFVSNERYRLGVGIPIDWIRVQQAMSMEL